MADAPPSSPEEALRARVELPQLERQLAEQTLAARDHDRRTDAARHALVAALDAEYQKDLDSLVDAAVNTLRPAMAAMAVLARRQHQHAEATGRAFMYPVYMPGLLPEADTAASIWLDAMGCDVTDE